MRLLVIQSILRVGWRRIAAKLVVGLDLAVTRSFGGVVRCICGQARMSDRTRRVVVIVGRVRVDKRGGAVVLAHKTRRVETRVTWTSEGASVSRRHGGLDLDAATPRGVKEARTGIRRARASAMGKAGARRGG